MIAPIDYMPDTNLRRQEIEAAIQRVLLLAGPRHERVLRIRFGIETEKMMLRELAKCWGVTPDRIRQIECKAYRQMRKKGRKKLRAALDDLNEMARGG